MLNWYQTKENCSVQHGTKVVKPGEKLLLSEEQAALHNSIAEQVDKCEPPKSESDCAVKEDFDEFKKASGKEKEDSPPRTAKK